MVDRKSWVEKNDEVKRSRIAFQVKTQKKEWMFVQKSILSTWRNKIYNLIWFATRNTYGECKN